MDTPEKLETQGTKDEEKQNNNTTQYVLDTTIPKQTQHNMCWTPLYPNKHNTICVGRHYTQTNTNKVNKTTGDKDELNIVFMRKS